MNYEIEEEILGNLALYPNLIDRFVVPAEAFLDPTNQFIFKLFEKQFKDSKTISIPLLVENYKNDFTQRFQINEVILKINNMMSTATPIESKFDYFQETLFYRYTRNCMMKAIKDFNSQRISQDELFDTLHKYENMAVATDDHKLNCEEIYKIISSKNKNIDFRFETISKHANIQEHDLVIVAGRPGTGKTAFALNLLEDLSDSFNCIFFNMEMSEQQVYQRLVGINTKIPIRYLNNPETDYQKSKIKEGCRNLANKKNSKHKYKLKIIKSTKNGHTIVFIDYVGLIDNKKNQSSYERITEIVKELRRISLDYDCTIFLMAQINRESAKNVKNSKDEEEPMPTVRNLKDSGELEQTGTTVLLLWDKYSLKNASKSEVELNVIIGKNRNGKKGIVPIYYDKERQRFDSFSNHITKEPGSWRKEK